MDHAQQIINSTQEIFSSMIMLDVTPGEPFSREREILLDSIS
ncbi:MAG: chemotaxis protein CheX, partial [Desulfuromonadaceae bacterium]|nr:chemotaxis protein CheX [Desulfuromonadaceae bacterium]